MPALHRYFGTPLTTWMLNIVYSTRFSDIHCGMRGVTTDAMRRMDLRSQAWQYASEMIIKSVHLGLKTAEVPVKFYKDREGRESHHKRIGWFEPWRAGWLTVQTMFTFGADFFLIRPGAIMLAAGGVGAAALFGGPRVFAGIGFSLHWMLMFVTTALVGAQLLMMGAIARMLYDREHRKRRIWDRIFHFNTAILSAIAVFLCGVASMLPLVEEYITRGFRLLPALSLQSYEAVGGVGMVLLSFTFFTSSLVYNAVSLSSPSGAAREELAPGKPQATAAGS
jgi:hypothetical protein